MRSQKHWGGKDLNLSVPAVAGVAKEPTKDHITKKTHKQFC